jgi:hypothetical protein
MRISELRSHVRGELVEFAWDQWAQMGVLSTARLSDRWAADPEALLLLSLEVARSDARLFDEIMDWLVINERLVSIQRLRNLCRDDTDRALVEASLAWAAQSRQRPQPPSKRGSSLTAPEPLFRGLSTRLNLADETFRAYGWLKPRTERSGKSRPPNVLAPINLAFRLRQILGVGARAEVVRFLLTSGGARANVQLVTESAFYAKRNVQEAVTALQVAGVLEGVVVGNEQRFTLDRERWGALLGLAPDDLPTYRAWPQLFCALRRLVRWLEDEANEAVTDYMLASDARQLAAEITPELRYAAARIPEPSHTGADYWQDFVALVSAALACLEGAPGPRGRDRAMTIRTPDPNPLDPLQPPGSVP